MSASFEIADSHLRTLATTFSWRVVATLTTMAVAFGVTGHVAMAVTIGSIEFVVKLIIYYMHERAWHLVPRRLLP